MTKKPIQLKQKYNPIKAFTAMKTNKEIKALFANMKSQPIFEINLLDYIDTIDEDEYIYCFINYDAETNMLQYGECCNTGFYYVDEREYNKYFSIDENLQSLLELFIENSINEYNNEN